MITAIQGRIVYNSRGSKSIEVEIKADHDYAGRAAAPSGASVGAAEAKSFPSGGPEASLAILKKNEKKFVGLDPADIFEVHNAFREIDDSEDYSKAGGSLAYAVSMAAVDAAAKQRKAPFFSMLSRSEQFRMPYPLGNILGGGAHAGPGTPDIQEILVAPTGAKTLADALERNFAVHRELGRLLRKKDPAFTNGRGDEGGWAPKADNIQALDMAVSACESLGYVIGQDVSLGVDFAASTQWRNGKYAYERGGFENSPGEQIEFVSGIISKYKLAYAEDPLHEDAFHSMPELAKRFPNVLITGDDLTATNAARMKRAISSDSCNAAILKVNQAGTLYDALKFADTANRNGISLVTSHRSGETADSHITHVGVATGSKMLKAGILGGERVAKLNEMLRISENELICGMAKI